MVKLPLSFAMLGLGLATAASAAAVGTEPGSAFAPGQIGDDELYSALKNVKTSSELRNVLQHWVPRKFGSIFDEYWGICKENSEVCKTDVCDLGSSDCERVTGQQKDELIQGYEELYFIMLSTGKCKRTSKTEDWCNKEGFCRKYDVKGEAKEQCRDLELRTRSKDVMDILSSLVPYPDGHVGFRDDKPPTTN